MLNYFKKATVFSILNINFIFFTNCTMYKITNQLEKKKFLRRQKVFSGKSLDLWYNFNSEKTKLTKIIKNINNINSFLKSSYLKFCVIL